MKLFIKTLYIHIRSYIQTQWKLYSLLSIAQCLRCIVCFRLLICCKMREDVQGVYKTRRGSTNVYAKYGSYRCFTHEYPCGWHNRIITQDNRRWRLFNAVSILLCGDEHYLFMILRYHTCLNMVDNREVYMTHEDRRLSQTKWWLLQRLCYNGRIFFYLNHYVVDMPIRVIYPYFKRKEYPTLKILNRVFYPTGKEYDNNPLCILWYC